MANRQRMLEKETLGLQIAWLDDEPDSVAKAVSYLEDKHFIVHFSSDIDQFKNWVCYDGYDIVLTDLLMPGRERQGDDVIRELRGGGVKVPIVAVSRYLEEFKAPLNKLSAEYVVPTIDKDIFTDTTGLENFRLSLLNQTGGGKVKVVEKVIGYIEEELEDHIIVCIKLDSGKREKLIFEKSILSKLGGGKLGRYLEIKTIERMHGYGVDFKTSLRWVQGPDWTAVES